MNPSLDDLSTPADFFQAFLKFLRNLSFRKQYCVSALSLKLLHGFCETFLGIVKDNSSHLGRLSKMTQNKVCHFSRFSQKRKLSF